MIMPPERIADACRLGVEDASSALALARGGDLSALATWTVYAVFRAHARGLPGTPSGEQEALDLTQKTFAQVDVSFRRAA